uniref:Uncharacterized protein n=1 Tax=Schistocephalus solidus TaxID=70667 RepID=A0A0X3NU71_SCHSO
MISVNNVRKGHSGLPCSCQFQLNILKSRALFDCPRVLGNILNSRLLRSISKGRPFQSQALHTRIVYNWLITAYKSEMDIPGSLVFAGSKLSSSSPMRYATACKDSKLCQGTKTYLFIIQISEHLTIIIHIPNRKLTKQLVLDYILGYNS